MTHVIVLSVWQLVLLVVAVAIGTSIPCAAFGAWLGARRAIRICSAHNDCAKVKTEKRIGWQDQLKRQHDELLRENPEAMARWRAAEDRERDGHG